jgi:hypothetical protein
MITKRRFLMIFGLGITPLIIFNLSGYIKLKVLFRKVKNRLKPSTAAPVVCAERGVTELPHYGETVSVEMALNSRCSSDDDNDPTLFHWGMFDSARKLSSDQINKIISSARICRFTDKKIRIGIDDTLLSFMVDSIPPGIERDWLMVESGMQQQAVALVCAALGCGNLLLNQGKNGAESSSADIITIKMRIDAMKPSYDGTYWSAAAPTKEAPWLKGNLHNPLRDGTVPILSAIKNSAPQKSGGSATMQSLGQLLWAARGRTPHLYKSTPWGMTIPTWGGEQNISSVYVLADCTMYLYVNWKKSKPTHSIIPIGDIERNSYSKIKKSFPSWNAFILLCANETSGRAFWEIGYQVQNLLVQTYALDFGYTIKMLDAEERKIFQNPSINNPIALVALHAPSFQPISCSIEERAPSNFHFDKTVPKML